MINYFISSFTVLQRCHGVNRSRHEWLRCSNRSSLKGYDVPMSRLGSAFTFHGTQTSMQNRRQFLAGPLCSADETRSTNEEPDDESLDYDMLKRRMRDVRVAEDSGAEISDIGLRDPLEGIPTLYVLLVNANSEDRQEGIYCLRINGYECVLAFVEEESCARFATYIEAQDLPATVVEAFPSGDIQDFCEATGHHIGLIQPGAVFMPPEKAEIDDMWLNESSRIIDPRPQEELQDFKVRLNRLLDEG
mmetsp:Transcript_5433/g.8440  ORF Transcript_5433/g.8440 Transcript_5433/m.8440 type:complete len:247 (+) Transcript_5433:33-773(+)